MQLSGAQHGVLKKVVLDTYSTLEFEEFLLTRMEVKLGVITAIYKSFGDQVSDVLKHFNNLGHIPGLLSALIADRPQISYYVQLAYDFGVLAQAYNVQPNQILTRQGLESLVNSDPVFPVNLLIEGISTNKRCVCRIKVEKENGMAMYGTGFLISKDLVLSNFHVFEPVIQNPSLAGKVICKFDYEASADKTINPGTDIGLSNNSPLIAYSPYCDFDSQGTDTVNVVWPDNMLDYAVVKLDAAIGEMAFGPNAQNASSEKRGWIKYAEPHAGLTQGSHLFILQHPQKQPMKLAIGLSKVVGCDPKGLRVRYNINTMEGSSGSPCFDQQFNWTALHNMGDPNWNPQYNQGIPADKIMEDLTNKGIDLQ